jgi:DNA-binding CsgD family transcriptional regulator
MGGGDGAVEDLEDSGSTNRNTTMRQKAVLELLSRGSPNKVIARRLGMSQGAVKFHVRQIMHKFGVTNRTEVAAVCATQPSILGAMADAVQADHPVCSIKPEGQCWMRLLIGPVLTNALTQPAPLQSLCADIAAQVL